MRARQTPATVTAASTGHTHPEARASRSVVTGNEASMDVLAKNIAYQKHVSNKIRNRDRNSVGLYYFIKSLLNSE